MQLQQLTLVNFRNYANAKIDFGDGVHVIHGNNGAGKTTILEAVHYLALTKSFRATTDKHLVLSKQDMCRVHGTFLTAQGQTIRTNIAYSHESGKHLTVNGQKIPRFSEYIGAVPIVLLHPSDLSLSQGGPFQRRRFLDVLLSQSSKVYLDSLIQYNRSLRQRNLLLQNGQCDAQLLQSWEENLITHGAEIIRKRHAAVAELNERAKRHYLTLSEQEDKTHIVYECNIKTDDMNALEENYRQTFERRRASEREQGTTGAGPHRDDLLFLLNGKPMKTHASQGEHKTMVIALKLAEYHHLEAQQHQAPILLFDDIFGELDALRIQRMLAQLIRIGQVFVTTTSRSFFDKIQQLELPTAYYHVQIGSITRT